jgi:hypothetical protein
VLSQASKILPTPHPYDTGDPVLPTFGFILVFHAFTYFFYRPVILGGRANSKVFCVVSGIHGPYNVSRKILGLSCLRNRHPDRLDKVGITELPTERNGMCGRILMKSKIISSQKHKKRFKIIQPNKK